MANLKLELVDGSIMELTDVKTVTITTEPDGEYGPHGKNIQEAIDILIGFMYDEVNTLPGEHGSNSYIIIAMAMALKKFQCPKADDAVADALTVLESWNREEIHKTKESKKRRVTSQS